MPNELSLSITISYSTLPDLLPCWFSMLWTTNPDPVSLRLKFLLAFNFHCTSANVLFPMAFLIISSSVWGVSQFPCTPAKYMLYQNRFSLRHFRSFGMAQKSKSIFCSFRGFKFISYPCQVAHSPRRSNVSRPCGHLALRCTYPHANISAHN